MLMKFVRLGVVVLALAVVVPVAVSALSDEDCWVYQGTDLSSYGGPIVDSYYGYNLWHFIGSFVSCGEVGQNWVIATGGSMCEGQGWTSSGQGYILTSWEFTYQDSVGNTWFDEVNSEQYDCGDIT